MIEAYVATRPTSESSNELRITANSRDLIGRAGAIEAVNGRAIAEATPVVVDHEITRHIRWPTKKLTAAASTDVGWQPLVTIDGVDAIAIAEWPARQIFVGLIADGFDESADYVVLWANIFHWLGGEATFVPDGKTPFGQQPAVDDVRALAAVRRAVVARQPAAIGLLATGAIAIIAAAYATASIGPRRVPIPVDTRR